MAVREKRVDKKILEYPVVASLLVLLSFPAHGAGQGRGYNPPAGDIAWMHIFH